MDIKLTLTSLSFLILTLLDYKKCRHRDIFCYNFPYGFYDLLKFIICAYFSYSAYLIYKQFKIRFNFIISIIFAIIYNPFVKLAFEKDEWHIINIITIFVIIALAKDEIITLYKKYKRF